MYENEMNFF